MEQFNLDTATLAETKAVAYDVLSSLQKLQNDLQILNNAIVEKQKKLEEATKNPVKK